MPPDDINAPIRGQDGAALFTGRGEILLDGIRGKIVSGVGRRFFYGWTIVGVASLVIFASGPGQSHTFSVFVEPIGRDLGVSSAAIATAYGLATLFAASLAYMLSKIPMGRLGMAGEAAALVAWLCSAECSFSTGAVFDLSGGRATY